MTTQAQISTNNSGSISSQMGDLAIAVEIAADQAVAHLRGRLEFYSHRAIRAALDDVLASKEIKQLTINLARVEYVSSSGIGMLLVVKDMTTAVGIALRLANPIPHVREIFEIAKLGKLIPILNSEEAIH